MSGKGVDIEAMPPIVLFAGLQPEELALVARNATVIALARGGQLFRTGEPVTHFYFLRRGQMKLLRVSSEGAEKVIAVVQPGQTFAEAAMFSDARGYPVTAAAIDDSEILAFGADSIRKLLAASPETCLRIMAIMSTRLHELVVQIEELTLHNASYRLVAYLLDQLPPGAVHTRDIQLMTPKSVIASRLSIQPETFSRILARLRDAGLITSDGAQIVVRDVEGLRRSLR